MPRGLAIFALTWLTACTCCPCPAVVDVPPGRDPTAWFDSEDQIAYEHVFWMGRVKFGPPPPSEQVSAWLHEIATGSEPVLRNAAARRLLDRGVQGAAWYLIANLHRDQRTFVVTDAIYHLRQVFGMDLGYEPNRGYRHQTEVQAEWVAWFREQPFGHDRPLVPREPKPRPTEAQREAVAQALDALRATDEEEDEDGALEDAAIMELWRRVAETTASSRHPEDVCVVAEVFGELASRRPRVQAFWNNYALALLNDGRHEMAEAAYRRALALTPEDAQLHNDLGILLEAVGRLKEAEAAYTESLRLRPDDDVAAANLGDVLAKQGQEQAAIQAWRRAARLAPDKWHYHRKWIERLSR